MTTAATVTMVKDHSLARDIVSIFKLRIAVAIMLSAVGGAAVTPGVMPGPWQMTILALSVFLASASAGAFNQWAEADLDRQMKRTASRPFAAGRFQADGLWLTAILGLLAVSILMAAWSSNWRSEERPVGKECA